MATYQEIKGGKLKNYTEDPDNPYVGQLWYNTTVHGFRIRKSTLGSSWSSGGNLNTARAALMGAGTQTAGLAFGGANPDAVNNTEQYDGTSWTEVADLATARGGGGEAQNISSSTSALYFGGGTPAVNATEEFTEADFTINPVTTS